MPTQDTHFEAIEVLLCRDAVVERMSVGSTTKRELVDDLGVSRSTIDRAVREIESVGLSECGERIYRSYENRAEPVTT